MLTCVFTYMWGEQFQINLKFQTGFALRGMMARVAAVVSNGCDSDPRVLREARWLSDVGHDVEIHAFDRFENLLEIEHVSGIKIIRHRVGKTPYGDKIKTIIGLRKFRKSVSRAIQDADIVHCHDADTLGVRLPVDAKLIFDMHDLAHTWILMAKPKSAVRKIIATWMCRRMLRRAKLASGVVTSSPGFVEWLGERGVQSISVENRPTAKETLPLPNQPVIGYIGKIRELESFTQLVKALELINPDKRPKLFVAGSGVAVEKVHKLIKKSTVDAEIHGSYTWEELPKLISKISIMYAMYTSERGNIDDGALPAKMFEAASFGRPTIVNSNTPMAEVCVSENLGVAVEWGNISELSEALLSTHNMPIKLIIDEQNEQKKFLSVIEKI